MILAILQARVSSSRLPGKVLKPILGKPMLVHQIERVRRSAGIGKLVVATSTEASDNPLETLGREHGFEVFRGSLNDVLDRFYQVAAMHNPDQIIRLTGDCPLIDPALVEELIGFHAAGKYDYSSNSHEPTLPDGMDAEIFTFASLAEAWREAKLASQREHVTPFIEGQPERYRIGNLKYGRDLSHLRWTVDEADDFEVVQAIFAELYPRNPGFGMADILEFLERNPGLKTKNTHHARNEGYLKSLQAEEGRKP